MQVNKRSLPATISPTGTYRADTIYMVIHGKPICIADNAWIGANCVINPGVRIGENSIIGAGSVVTHDIPANVVAVGNPCEVLRKLNIGKGGECPNEAKD